jgi:hypothetical protein
MTVDVSKTYDFNPNLGSMLLAAFNRCRIRPTELTPTHIRQGELASNFILSEFSNLQPMLWAVNLTSIPLLEGSGTYSLPAEIVMILDAYVSTSLSDGSEQDRILSPISRTDYASIPNKSQEGYPTQFWFDRLISPVIKLWPVPDGNGPYVFRYYSVRQNMDSVAANGKTVEIPYRFLETYVAGLAWKISEMYAPELEDKLFNRYQRSFNIAAIQDTENVPMYLTPGLSGYFIR